MTFLATPAIYTIDTPFLCHIGVQKPGPQYSPAIYTIDKIDIDIPFCKCLIEYIIMFSIE